MPCLHCRFFQKHLDNDILRVLESTVPPLKLDELGAFRSCLFKYKRKARPRGTYDSDEGRLEITKVKSTACCASPHL